MVVKVTKEKARAVKCLGGKLEDVALNPDPKTFEKLTEEYNCLGCNDLITCNKVYSLLAYNIVER